MREGYKHRTRARDWIRRSNLQRIPSVIDKGYVRTIPARIALCAAPAEACKFTAHITEYKKKQETISQPTQPTHHMQPASQ